MSDIKEAVESVTNFENIEHGYIMMKLDKIVVQKEFSKMFSIKKQLLNKITKSILEEGFDKSKPVALWEFKEQEFVLLDGHTRMRAAENAGLKEIPAIVMQFNNIDDAKLYTYKCQALRRNLTQQEIMEAVKLLGNKKNRDGKGRSVEKLSKEINISPSTLVHAKTVSERASEEDLNDIINDKKTINSVYQKIKKPKNENVDDNGTCIEKAGKVGSEIGQPKLTIAPNLVNLEDILNLLKEHNEKNAVSIILEKYKKMEIQD